MLKLSLYVSLCDAGMPKIDLSSLCFRRFAVRSGRRCTTTLAVFRAVSGLLFTVLELPVLWAPLGVGEVGDSLLSSVLPVSELPDPELTPLKQKNYFSGFFPSASSKYFLVSLTWSSGVSPFLWLFKT